MNNDIAKYLKGELSPAEMHALEQKALQDPFLAEALEGAEQAGAEDFAFDIDLLQRSIQAKTKRRKPKTISLNGWGLYSGIAAGLTLLAVSTYVIFVSIKQERTSTLADAKQHAPSTTEEKAATNDSLIAQVEPITPPVEEPKVRKQPNTSQPAGINSEVSPTVGPSLADADSSPVTDTEETTSDQPSAKRDETAGYVTSDANTSTTGTLRKPVVEPENNLDKSEGSFKDDQEVTRDVKHDGNTRMAKRTVEPNAGITQHRSGDISRSLESRSIRGKVVSSDGAGIAGVNVVIKGTNQGTVTDESGNYEISVHPEQSLTFDFIGYTTEEREVEESSGEVNVKLDPDVQALSEVVVTGAGAIKGEEPVIEMAEPVGGRKAFKNYLEENILYPAEAIQNKIEGKVTVQFTVEEDGNVTDFRIIKGLGFGCDEELIRLIKEGPKWKPSRKDEVPIRENVKVRLKFELPK